MILGIDEVGRGPWAGPLVVGAVILGGAEIDGLDDSKKLTKKRRQDLDALIRQQAAAWALGWVSARELDDIGMSEALRLATRRAVEQIQAICRDEKLGFDEIIIDGTVNFLRGTALEKFVAAIPKADGLIPSVSAASIIAKVARDQFMAEQDAVYPGYGFKSNAGYGVAKHRAAIERLGVTPLHRLSFAPLAKYAVTPRTVPRKTGAQSGEPPVGYPQKRIRGPRKVALIFSEDTAPDGSICINEKSMTTRQIGDKGEQAAADWLAADGHEIVARNWRTRYCEIDIVSVKGEVLYFTEVKYRKNDDFGDGLAAITAKKQRQMRFAAELFLAGRPEYSGMAAKLLAASVSGDPPAVQAVVEVN
ncbi:MAG: ribonuclease HII [Candidatus Nanogingivalaceae bacterium]|nr:ribonuclease HII [Candidatus Nanogingivalaceae bacterium]